ncbi:MAG: hypothetical protein ABIW80_02170 [Lapillicoccus sp.]
MNTDTSERGSAPAYVRPADDDVVPIQRVAVGNGVFALDEMAGFDEMLRRYLDGSIDQHRWIAPKA